MTHRTPFHVVMLGMAIAGCHKSEDAPARDQPKPEPVFRCRKVSFGPGDGRICAGPNYLPGNVSADEVFAAQEAWCITQRVSWTNPRSFMRCVPTEGECKRDLMITPAGKENAFLRSGCTRTVPEAWTAKEADYSVRDAFNCTSEKEYWAKSIGGFASKCIAFPADLLDRGKTIVEKAWCFEGPEKGEMFNMHCYQHEDECQLDTLRRGSQCTLLEAAPVIDSEYGHLDKRD